MILNCDLVVASQDAKFALPEVKRGVVAIQGGKYSAHSCGNLDLFFVVLSGSCQTNLSSLSIVFIFVCYILLLLKQLFTLGIPRLSQIVGHQVKYIIHHGVIMQ